MWIWILLIIVAMPLVVVRLLPSDPERWHRQASPVGLETQKRAGGYVWRQRVDGNGAAKLQALDTAARAEPRTVLLAGSVDAGQVTYVTRSRVFGFPDYTTMGLYTAPDGQRYIEVYARLRFGRSDLGVNAKRVKGWLAAVEG